MRNVMLIAMVALMCSTASALVVKEWEENMDTDPYTNGGGWGSYVRPVGLNYTIGGGMMTMNGGAFTTQLDLPTGNYIGTTIVEVIARPTATTGVIDYPWDWDAPMFWMNVGGDSDFNANLRVTLKQDGTNSWAEIMNKHRVGDDPDAPSCIVTGDGTNLFDASKMLHVVWTINDTLDPFDTDGGTYTLTVTDGTVSGSGSGVYVDDYGEGSAGGMFGTIGGGSAEVDYVKYTSIPEPMTVALLGLGGLFLRRRR